MASFVDTRPLPGGPISVDLLNTRWGPIEDGVDWLDADESVRVFASSHGVDVGPTKIASAREALVDARLLVQALFQTAPAAVDSATATAIDAALGRANVRLEATAHGPQVAITSDDGITRITIEAILDAIDHVRERPDRIRSCEHGPCTLWFVDTSKAGRRRWCSMETCGNRAKARRHYARTTDQS